MRKTRKITYLLFTTIVVLLILNRCSLPYLIQTPKAYRIISKATLKNENFTIQSFDFKSNFGLIILSVTIQGEKYNFIFDTGAQVTVISDQLAQKLKLKSKGNISIKDAHDTKKKLPVAILDSLSIHAINYKEVGVVVHDFNQTPIFSCINIDGIIGMNIIQLTNWKAYFDENRIEITPLHSSFEKSDLSPIKMQMKLRKPFIKLNVNSSSENFLIDTGNNSSSVSLSQKICLPCETNKVVGYSSFGIYGKTKFDTTQYALAHLSLDTNVLSDSVIVSKGNIKENNIGIGFLRKYFEVISFDFQKNILGVSKRDSVNPHIYNYGFSPMSKNNQIVVGAKDIGIQELQVGDTLLAVDGMSLKENPCYFFQKSFSSPKNQSQFISITVIQESDTNTHEFPLKPILNFH